jgi:hypothetical protein
LPNRFELASLLDLGNNLFSMPTGYPFTNVQSDYYWSSTTRVSDSIDAWSIGMPHGLTRSVPKTSDYYIWAVRSDLDNDTATDPPAPVLKTGQKISYQAGDDGYHQKGVDWPDPRFTDNGDGTVTDHLTGLMWSKDANANGTMTWNDAIDYANNLSLGSGGCGTYYTDWRVPNKLELESLLDLGEYSPTLPDGHPFSNVQSESNDSSYWSSTTRASWSDHAWFVSMNSWLVSFRDKPADTYVWPVRSAD